MNEDLESLKQQLRELQSLRNQLTGENTEVIENSTDISRSLRDELDEIDTLMKQLEEDIKESAKKYEESYARVKTIIEDFEKELEANALLSEEEIKKLRETTEELKLSENEKSAETKRILDEQKKIMKAFRNKRTKMENNIKKAEALDLTYDEYKDITSTLNKTTIMNRIFTERGLGEIADKKVSERTEEEKEILRQAKEDILDQIAQVKRANKDYSALDAIEALYSLEVTFYEKKKPRIEKIKKSELMIIEEKVQELPFKVVNPNVRVTDYVPEEQPVDMEDAVTNEEPAVDITELKPVEKVTVYKTDNDLYYVKKFTVDRFRLPSANLQNEERIDGNLCYRINASDVEKLKEIANNATDPFIIDIKDSELDSSKTLIPGTTIKKPREKEAHETFEDYQRFLENYYSRVFPVEEKENVIEEKPKEKVYTMDNPLDENFLANTPGLADIDLPHVKSVGDSFLSNNSELADIDLPHVKPVGESFLANNSELEDMDLPYAAPVGGSLFDDPEELADVELPDAEPVTEPVEELTEDDVEDVFDEALENATEPVEELSEDDVEDVYDESLENAPTPVAVQPEPDVITPIELAPVEELSEDEVENVFDEALENAPVVETPAEEEADVVVEEADPIVPVPIAEPEEEEEYITEEEAEEENERDQVQEEREEINVGPNPTTPTNDGEPVDNTIPMVDNEGNLINRAPREQYAQHSVEAIIEKLTRGLDIGPKDGQRYQASNIKVSKAFKKELKTGNYLYNIVHVVPAIIKMGFNAIKKLVNKLFLGKRGKQVCEEIVNRLNSLSEEEIKTLFEKYKGNRLEADMNNQINPLILDALKKYAMNKVAEYNAVIKENYNQLFAHLREVSELERRIALPNISEDERTELRAERARQRYAAATNIRTIEGCYDKANNLLSSGISGLEEDFKAVASKLPYVGMRFAKQNKFNNELQEALAEADVKLVEGLHMNNAKLIVEGFMEKDALYYDNTKVRVNIRGRRSVGDKYYTPYVEQGLGKRAENNPKRNWNQTKDVKKMMREYEREEARQDNQPQAQR